MKGNASTSLMKTLISKKPPPPPPPLCSSSSSSANTTTSINSKSASEQIATNNNKSNKTEISKLKTQFNKEDTSPVRSELNSTLLTANSQPTSNSNMPNSSSSSTSPQLSNNREQTPIGTKFALTMLGINNPNSNSVSNSSNSAILFPKNTSQLQQRANSDTSVSSNESSVSNLQLYDESNEYKPIIKPESSIYDHNPLSPTSHTAKLLKKQTEENGDSLSPVAFSFSKTISLNESNIKLEAEQNEQINIKKQKLFDSATAAASRKNNVLLKKLLSTSTTKSPTDTSASSSSLFNVNTSPLLSTVNRQCSDFQAEFDLSPILVEPSQNLEEEDVDGKNEINFSSPIMSPSGLDHEQELKNTLYSSLTNKNKPEKQSMKLNPSQFSKQSSSSVPSSAKEDIILRTLLHEVISLLPQRRLSRVSGM